MVPLQQKQLILVSSQLLNSIEVSSSSSSYCHQRVVANEDKLHRQQTDPKLFGHSRTQV